MINIEILKKHFNDVDDNYHEGLCVLEHALQHDRDDALEVIRTFLMLLATENHLLKKDVEALKVAHNIFADKVAEDVLQTESS